MSHTRSLELFEALQAAGFTPDDARRVTAIVLAPDTALATKADLTDLRAAIDKQFTDLYRWGGTFLLSLLVAITAIFATIVKVL